jgi:DNA-binding transcriptional MerR regulator
MDDERGEYMPQSDSDRAPVLKSPDAFRTISEVSMDLDVPQHVLRFWEGKFTQIRPLKRGGGRRYYRPEDVDLIRGIQHLLYGDGYTIKGVQKLLRENGVKFVMTAGRRGEPDPAPRGKPAASRPAVVPGRIEPRFTDPVAAVPVEMKREPTFHPPPLLAVDEAEFESEDAFESDPGAVASETAAAMEGIEPALVEAEANEPVGAEDDEPDVLEDDDEERHVSPQRRAAALAMLETLRSLKAEYDSQLAAIKRRA